VRAFPMLSFANQGSFTAPTLRVVVVRREEVSERGISWVYGAGPRLGGEGGGVYWFWLGKLEPELRFSWLEGTAWYCLLGRSEHGSRDGGGVDL